MSKITQPVFSYGGIKFRGKSPAKPGTPSQAKEIVLRSAQRKALAVALRDDKPCLLAGDTGTGKTSTVRFLAYKMGLPYYRVSLDGHITPDELIGGRGAVNGSTVFEEGVIIKAMREGALLVVDELNAAPPDTLFIFHSLLDDDHAIRLPTGEIVKPHKDFRFFATMNRDYSGTKELNMAFFDRFPLVVEIDAPPPKQELELIKATQVDEPTATKMLAYAVMARKAYKEGKALTYASTRSLLQWGDLIVKGGMTALEAFNLSVSPKANPEEQEALRDLYRASFQVAPDGSDSLDPVIIAKGELDDLKKQANETINVRLQNEADIRDLKTRLSDTERELGVYKTRADSLQSDKEQALAELLKMQERIKTLEYLEKLIKQGGYDK